MGPLIRDSAFNVGAWEVRKGFNRLCSWLAETWTKTWCTVSDLKMFNVGEEIQRLRKIRMLVWFCHLRPTHPYWKGPILWAINVWAEPQYPWWPDPYSGNCSDPTWKPECNDSNCFLGWQGPSGGSQWPKVTKMGNSIKAAVRIVWLTQTYGIGLLIMVSLEVK